MALYAYKGIGPSGKPVSGVKDAESPKAVRQAMRRDGVVVTDVDLSKGKKSASRGKGINKDVDFGDFFGGVKKAEIGAFTRQLATLVKAGIPLAESLGAMFEQTENIKFKHSIEQIRSAVNEGSSLADALSKHPKLFDDLFVSMVRAGETAGNLDDVLIRLADFLESSEKLKSKVQGAMAYPLIMIAVGVIIMVILMVAVVPKITGLFKQQDKALPLNTELLIGFADFLKNHWLLTFVFIGLAIWGARAYVKSKSGKVKWHNFLLGAPALGTLVKQIAVGRFARTLGTMLEAGVPMLRALDTAKEVLGNVILVDAVDKAKIAVTEGESLAVSLRRSGHFPPTVTHMIAVGERSGTLENMLLRVADNYDQNVDMKLTKFTSLLEPLMLVVMGGAVAFVVFSILMPLMDMSSFAGM
ncbi:MAG: type II secretion system inner membrane protein GspF [Deltaproteobacteria bacterium]|nr:type II secretion system inner membrane protein GspF [Deltaproteobacteria bacterium]